MAMNQKTENVFERPKKKPVNGAQETGNMVCQFNRQLAESDPPNEGFFPPRCNGEPFEAFRQGI